MGVVIDNEMVSCEANVDILPLTDFLISGGILCVSIGENKIDHHRIMYFFSNNFSKILYVAVNFFPLYLDE